MPDHDPGQLTGRQLDVYAGQLARCLKALGTDAPIRADVQRELATVRAERESRADGRPGRLPRLPASPMILAKPRAQRV